MKKGWLVLLVPLLLFSGCGGHGAVTENRDAAERHSLRDGRYVLSETSSDLVPYLLIHEGRYTVVKDIAVSYQPGGMIQRDGNAITFEGKYANEDYRYAFTLISNDVLRFELGQSKIPKSQSEWTDGMIFTLAEESTAGNGNESGEQNSISKAQAELRERFPEYSGLDSSKGLDVIVGQMSESSYFFYLLEHSETPREGFIPGLMALKSVSAEQLREILATYAISEDEVYIIPWEYSFSSYLPAYLVNCGGEDMDAKKEAYIAEIREMLFG